MVRGRTTKTISLSLPPEMAEKIKELMKKEERIQTAIEKLKAALVEPEENISAINKKDDNHIIILQG